MKFETNPTSEHLISDMKKSKPEAAVGGRVHTLQ
jgi:hypothetical protein